MRKILTAFFLVIVFSMVGCCLIDDDDSVDSNDPMGTLLVTVNDSSDDSAIEGASVTLYNDSNLVAAKAETDVYGEWTYSLSPGTYFVKVAAQGYNPEPLQGQGAIPFDIADGQTTTESVSLDTHPNAGNTGQISGSLLMADLSGVPGVLVVAEHDTLDLFATDISGTDGSYVLYNVEPGTYTLTAYRAGYRETSTPVTVDVTADGNHEDNNIEVEIFDSADLSGRITFLAVNNGIVDITLIHPDTYETIPGCSTTNDTNNNYLLKDIPIGTFIVWASFRNDGYVMDPDWIAKSGLPELTVTDTSTDETLDFSVTGAITITDPTNGASPVVPEIINSATPAFIWTKYASAKEYIVEVFDSQGNTIWGGFDSSGVVQHPQIDAQQTNVVFNLDGSATAPLVDGETYRWKIYADDNDALNVQILISSSENQMGLFTYIQN